MHRLPSAPGSTPRPAHELAHPAARAKTPRRLGLGLLSAVLAGALLSTAAPAAAKRARPATASQDSDSAATYAGRPEVQAFVEELMGQRPDLNRAWVDAALADARLMPSVRRYIMPPTTPVQKNWGVYRSRFVEPVRIKAGLAYWQRNERWLAAAEDRWKVPASVIMGIIGVETIYGRQTGGFRVIDALATLAFDFPTGRSDRSPFFRSELANFLVWAHQEKTDPLKVLGSYAGAIGLPQFMPSSILKHAVDFDGDGRIDLQNSAADAIGSVANYFVNHGWQPGMATHYTVTPPDDNVQRATLLAPDLQPTFTPQDMLARGAQLSEAALKHPGPLALVQLLNGADEPSYVAGTQNFWVITRYNWSAYYAMAVIDLAQALQRARMTSEASR